MTDKRPAVHPIPAKVAPKDVGEVVHRSDSLQETLLKFAIAGIGNCTSSTILQPVDLIKVRQQLQKEKPTSQNFFRVGYDMWKLEGPKSLANGLTASIMRDGTYSTVRFGSYDGFKNIILRNSNGKFKSDSPVVKISAGLLAGCVGATFANPCDLVKIRMQAYSNPPRYRNTFHAFAEIYRTEGLIKGLYRGVTATTFRAALVTCSQISAYDISKQSLLKSGYFREGWPAHLAASASAGLMASLTSAPVDTIKVRYMNDPTHYKNVLECTVSLLKREGPIGLYKGFFMCWCRLFPHTIMTLMIMEQLRKAWGVAPM